jgi:hypothetical protein
LGQALRNLHNLHQVSRRVCRSCRRQMFTTRQYILETGRKEKGNTTEIENTCHSVRGPGSSP